MSNEQRDANLVQIVKQAEPNFQELAKIHNAVHFQRESSFALQALENNYFLMGIARSNPDSLKRAIIDVAAIGLSLSPVHKLAYLVPRDKKVCLDISYRGLIQLAVEVGSIKWAKAELVYESDYFELSSLGQEPAHKFNPFSKDRGELLGGYCVAKTHDGEFITTHMTVERIHSIRNRSMSWRAYLKDNSKSNPWLTDPDEMMKKTLIKNGYKSWPMTDTSKRLDQAIDVTNSSDEIDFNSQPKALPQSESERNTKLEKIIEMLAILERTEAKFVEHLSRQHNREIKSLTDLTSIEADQAISFLSQFTKNKESVDETA